MGNKRKTLHSQMAFSFKELQKHFPKFVHSVFLHGSYLLMIGQHANATAINYCF